MTEKQLRLIARLIEKLQVPVSLHTLALVEVGPVYDELRRSLGLFGWLTAEEIMPKLRGGRA